MRAFGILAILAILVSASGLTASSARTGTDGALAEAWSAQASQQAELAIIVNKSNPTDSISYSELREYFLAERYCLYHRDHHDRPYRLDIHHAPWRLQPARAEIARDAMAEVNGLTRAHEPPLLHFVKRQDMVAWLPSSLR